MSSMSLPGYASFHIPAFKKNPLGCLCVGIYCFAKCLLFSSLSQVSSNSRYFQILFIPVKTIQILLFNVYIPPVAIAPSDLWAVLEKLIVEATKAHSSASLIILRDLNTRIVPNNTSLAHHWLKDDQTPP